MKKYHIGISTYIFSFFKPPDFYVKKILKDAGCKDKCWNAEKGVTVYTCERKPKDLVLFGLKWVEFDSMLFSFNWVKPLGGKKEKAMFEDITKIEITNEEGEAYIHWDIKVRHSIHGKTLKIFVTERSDLKPCPFCGNKAKIHYPEDMARRTTFVYCTNDECSTSKTSVDAWNTRM